MLLSLLPSTALAVEGEDTLNTNVSSTSETTDGTQQNSEDTINSAEKLEAALADAGDGDVIELADGIYEFDSNLKIESAVTINGNGQTLKFNVGNLYYTGSDDSNLVLNDLTIDVSGSTSNMAVTYGGQNSKDNLTVTLNDCTLVGNGKNTHGVSIQTVGTGHKLVLDGTAFDNMYCALGLADQDGAGKYLGTKVEGVETATFNKCTYSFQLFYPAENSYFEIYEDMVDGLGQLRVDRVFTNQYSDITYVIDSQEDLDNAIQNQDDGQTWYIAAGTYTVNETLKITKSISIVGAGSGAATLAENGAGEGTTIIQMGSSLTMLMQVANVDFSVSGIYFKGMETPAHNNHSALCVGNGGAGNTVSITNCKFTGFTKNSITVKGGDATVTGNDITCEGYDGAAGNGIQISDGATAVVNNNQIRGYQSQAEGWSATGLLIVRGGQITEAKGNVFAVCEEAISLSEYWDEPEDETSMPANIGTTNTMTECGNTVTYQLGQNSDVAAILNEAQSGSKVIVYGSCTLKEDAAVKDGVSFTVYNDDGYVGELTIESGATLTVQEGASMYNDGTVTNNGAIVNYGELSNNEGATFTNSGSLTNGGTITGDISGNETVDSLVEIGSDTDLVNAIKNQAPGQTWVFTAEGTYDANSNENEGGYELPQGVEIYPGGAQNPHVGPYVFPIYVDNLTITKRDGVGEVVLTSTVRPGEVAGGAWNRQSFMIISGSNVTIEDITLLGNNNDFHQDGNDAQPQGGQCDKIIETVMDAGNLTLRNVKIAPITCEGAWDTSKEGTQRSGSLYFSHDYDASKTVTLENVYTYGGIKSVNNVNISLNGVTVDATNNTYAEYDKDTSSYAWNPGIRGDGTAESLSNVSVEGAGFTIVVDDSIDVRQIFNDSLLNSTTIQLKPGEYDVTIDANANGKYGSGMIIAQDGITVEAYDPANKPVLYGFSNEFNAGVDASGKNGQDTVYVSGQDVTLENLKIMPLGGIGEGANNWQKTVEVVAGAAGFTMTGCETMANDKTLNGQENSMNAAAGYIHVSIDDAVISNNSFGEGTTVAAGWTGNTAAEGTYSVDVSGNYWGQDVTIADIAGKVEGNVTLDSYYTDAAMTSESQLEMGGILVSNAEELQVAVQTADEGDVILVLPGDYDLDPTKTTAAEGRTGWYLPITTDNITIQGVDANGVPITDAKNAQATLFSTTEQPNGAWQTQDLIIVFANDVTIAGLKIMPNYADNKTIEITPDARDITIENCYFLPNDKFNDGIKYGSLYFNGDKGTVTVTGNYLEQTNLSFDSVDSAESIVLEGNTFDTPIDGSSAMISNVSWESPVETDMADVTVRENTFKNIPNDYNRAILNRMSGAFVLEENRVVKADGSLDSRDMTELVSFDDGFFGNWDEFVDSNPTIVIIENGVTRVLTPSEEEDGEAVVAKSLKVAPAAVTTYTGTNVIIYAELTGFDADALVEWTVSDTANTTYVVFGNRITFQASQAGVYTVTATANDEMSASAVITVQSQPVTPGGSTSGGSSDGEYFVSVNKPTNGKVTVTPGWADEGDTVTITVTPSSGYELDNLVVTDSKGKEVKLSAKGSNKYTFVMPDSKVDIKATFAAASQEQSKPFADVSGSDYYYDAVLWAVENGVTSGTSATTFGPNVTVTRAQMMTFLWRAHGSPKATGSNPFTDVSTSDYYYDAVLWAVANGITSGISADTFGPNNAVTRAQAVTFQWRASGSPAVSGNSFGDVSADAYYANAVAWAVNKSITGGTGNNQFSPDMPVTRAQAVTFLYRELG